MCLDRTGTNGGETAVRGSWSWSHFIRLAVARDENLVELSVPYRFETIRFEIASYLISSHPSYSPPPSPSPPLVTAANQHHWLQSSQQSGTQSRSRTLAICSEPPLRRGLCGRVAFLAARARCSRRLAGRAISGELEWGMAGMAVEWAANEFNFNGSRGHGLVASEAVHRSWTEAKLKQLISATLAEGGGLG